MVKCGLEIHQQLATKKLFCDCDSELSDEVLYRFERVLRPTQSELGEIDRAALEESLKHRRFIYEVTPNSCLVEADEEPPHELNREALEIALKIALMLNAQILDEIHVMRKIVIDGSNTSGFQRTALIAVNGYLETSFGRVGIPTICLEEEAARKIEEDDDKVVYRLDRLGIPLVEISTSPEMKSGEEVREVAARIGYLLRATKKVRRGVGTIRQDINISIGEGRVEIKGASRLNMIPKWVNNEIERQKMLRDIARILQERDARVEEKIYDLTDIFENTESRIIKNTLKRGGKILGIKLIGFQGVLKNGNLRLGKELAENVRVLGVKGLFHGDELPAYGISEEEVEKIIRRLELGPNDSFVIIGEKEEKVRIALQKVIDRAKKALIGVPDETRAPKDDGSTVYLRPLPGGARMYPETDIPPIRISEEYIEKLKKELPPLPDERLEELVSMGINREIGWQLIRDGMDDVFEELCTKYGYPRVVARALINGCEGIDYNRIFQYFSEGRFSKEAIDEIVMRACNGEKVEDIVRKFSEKVDIDQVIDEIMKEKMELVKERGMHAFKPLMGLAMQKLRGKVDGRIVSEKLRKRLEEIVNQESK
mgnify:CR=1 FL=1